VNYKSVATGISIIALLLVILGSVVTVTWPGDMTQFTNKDLANILFNNWGPTLVVLGALLFASMLGAVYIAQEDRE
jgi:NADH:ubiquinone oxidoreductase subunit 6 (subunit J)